MLRTRKAPAVPASLVQDQRGAQMFEMVLLSSMVLLVAGVLVWSFAPSVKTSAWLVACRLSEQVSGQAGGCAAAAPSRDLGTLGIGVNESARRTFEVPPNDSEGPARNQFAPKPNPARAMELVFGNHNGTFGIQPPPGKTVVVGRHRFVVEADGSVRGQSAGGVLPFSIDPLGRFRAEGVPFAEDAHSTVRRNYQKEFARAALSDPISDTGAYAAWLYGRLDHRTIMAPFHSAAELPGSPGGERIVDVEAAFMADAFGRNQPACGASRCTEYLLQMVSAADTFPPPNDSYANALREYTWDAYYNSIDYILTTARREATRPNTHRRQAVFLAEGIVTARWLETALIAEGSEDALSRLPRLRQTLADMTSMLGERDPRYLIAGIEWLGPSSPYPNRDEVRRLLEEFRDNREANAIEAAPSGDTAIVD